MVKKYFKSNELVPNSEKPVLIYNGAFNFSGLTQVQARDKVSEHVSKYGWYLDWEYFVYPYLHYHSTAYECLVVFSGTARIQLGGKDGEIFGVKSGDCLIIPPGVGHERVLGNERIEEFIVFGSYPNGQVWDFICEKPDTDDENAHSIYDKEFRRVAEENIKEVKVPTKDPIYGIDYKY